MTLYKSVYYFLPISTKPHAEKQLLLFIKRPVVGRLRPQFVADFYQILHTAQKCGWSDVWYFWKKAEVDT